MKKILLFSICIINIIYVHSQTGNVGIGTNTPKEKLQVAGNVLVNNNVIAGQGIATGKIERKVGPGTSSDNTWHTVELSDGYGGTAISAYATTSYLDGDIKIQGVDITALLTTTTNWYTTDAANVWKSVSVAKDASSGLTGDSRAYMVYCPNNTIATGWQAYANAQLDHYLKLRCTSLNSDYETVETNEGIESVYSFPRNLGDNITHVSVCPAGTFIKGLSMYANTYLDGNLTVHCTGIKRK
ncbi:MAG TPA: hypothetical protein PLJ42_12190 [Chitinophagales bacterium]|nr:hypothetical protein [Chitinophagales bacterium]HQW80184.1 hypothetical protein [Chitinophagales bacterium]